MRSGYWEPCLAAENTILKRRIATSLFTLLVAGAASAVTMFTPTLGEPFQITVGQTIDIEMRLETGDLVGAVNAIFDSAGLTINTCTAITTGAPDMMCNDLGGGKWQGTGSDFGGDGILNLDVLLTINVTGNAVGGVVTLLTKDLPLVMPENSNFTLCPTTLFNCLIIPDGMETAFDNEGSVLVEVVPEPGTAALVSVGLVSLAILRRATRRS